MCQPLFKIEAIRAINIADRAAVGLPLRDKSRYRQHRHSVKK